MNAQSNQQPWWLWPLLIIPGSLWGISYLVVDVILESIPPFSLAILRSSLAAIPMLTILFARGGRFPVGWKGWAPYFWLGFFNNTFPQVVVSYGQLTVSPGLATILSSLMPLLTVLIAHFVTEDERLNRIKFAGVGLGLLGIIVLIGAEVLTGIGDNVVGQLAIIAGVISYAIAANLSRRFLKTHNSRSPFDSILSLTGFQYVTSTLTLLPLTLVIDKPWTLTPTRNSIIAMFALSWLITFAATMGYYYAIGRFGAARASMTIYMIPINGVIWSTLLLGERLAPQAIVALVLIFAGIYLVNRPKV